MSKELVKLAHGEVGETYLRIPPGTSREQWNTIAGRISSIGHGYWWWVGDLATYALHNFGEKDSEEAIEQLSGATGAQREWLLAVAHCARRYAVKDRVVGLSISHHIRAARTPHGRRQALLKLALKRHHSAEWVGQRATPAKQVTVRLILRLPPTIVRNKKFLADLKDFCRVWKVSTYFLAGKGRAKNKRPRVAGRAVVRAVA